MSGLEAVVASVAKAIVERAFKEWLLARGEASQRQKPLVELIRLSFPDRFIQRKLSRQIGEVIDAVDHRLSPLIETEYGELQENDRAAILIAVKTAIESANLSDKAIFFSDLDPIKLARKVANSVSPPTLDLGETGIQLYNVILAEACEDLIRIIIQLPDFLGRATVEIFGRLTGLGDQTAAILSRLPVRTLDAPSGDDNDADFERRYLDFLSNSLDEVELFGVPSVSCRPRATLSVSYISLSTTPEDSIMHQGNVAPIAYSEFSTSPYDREPGSMRAETALSRSGRTLLRGEAGSGKTTLLRWIAIMAARGGFARDLKEWNGLVPFIIKLRSYPTGPLPKPSKFLDDEASPLAEVAPVQWVHRVLQAGRGIILIDGVDELPEKRRTAVRLWLKKILDTYSDLRIIVTSRPAAVDKRWLSSEGFASVLLTPMTPNDLRELVQHWHAAIQNSENLPCTPDKLADYERALLSRFEASSHLRALAATPLLAAMLCALNLDRVSQLPRNRMGIYDAVLELLLVRRDAAREIPSFQDVDLDRQQKEYILRGIAWYLSIGGRSEISKSVVQKCVVEKIAGMPRMEDSADRILTYLLERSGVIREPVPERIDFVHRTVQEYLTAAQIADTHDIELLINKAHLDQWRETVVMAAGHANSKLRSQLLSGLLIRAEAEPRHARRLHLLAAACLETVTDIPNEELRSQISQCLETLVPPRNLKEAHSLSTAGEEILRHLPANLEQLSESQATAVVRTCWLVNGPQALRTLRGYSRDVRGQVQAELVRGWSFFKPEQYAQQVLADTPFSSAVEVTNTSLIPGVRYLKNAKDLLLAGRIGALDFNFVHDLGSLRYFGAWSASAKNLDALMAHPEIIHLFLHCEDRISGSDVQFLANLQNLEMLTLWLAPLKNLEFVRHLQKLQFLSLSNLSLVTDFSPIASLPNLKHLTLSECKKLTQLSELGDKLAFNSLTLTGAELDRGIEQLSGFKNLRNLVLHNIMATDLTPLSGLNLLSSLNLGGFTELEDLTPLRNLGELRTLNISNSHVSDLSSLSGLHNLTTLNAHNCSELIDVSPLSRLENLKVVRLTRSNKLRGISLLRPTTKVEFTHSPVARTRRA